MYFSFNHLSLYIVYILPISRCTFYFVILRFSRLRGRSCAVAFFFCCALLRFLLFFVCAFVLFFIFCCALLCAFAVFAFALFLLPCYCFIYALLLIQLLSRICHCHYHFIIPFIPLFTIRVRFPSQRV